MRHLCASGVNGWLPAQIVLQLRMAELVDSTGLSENLTFMSIFQ